MKLAGRKVLHPMHNVSRVADMSKTTTPDMLGPADVCERLGIDRSTLTRWVKAGKIVPAMKLPGLRGAHVFTADEVERVAKRTAA